MSETLNGSVGAEVSATDIAVVGLAGRFPGARNVAELWDNLQNNVEAITTFTDEELKAAGVDQASLRNPNYVKSGAVMPDMEFFDASFFGFSPRDAAIMDPQHRHFLETIWEALESSGYTADGFPGTIGVFAGSGQHAYLMYNLISNPDLMRSVGMFLVRHTGNDKDFLTTRASYLLNLTGPSVNIQTACSTSLVAIHVAAQSLLNGECDLALAGGVTIEVPHRRGYEYQEGEILSPDGHCRAFDAQSQGTIFGSGVGIVALRRLADALAAGDTIHAVIKGSAVNNDGSLKAGYLAPSVEGQAKAISEALAISGVDADSITYVEAHGTGTPVGDPIEVAALTQAFRVYTDATGFCGIGSLKTNIGHLDTAAGVAGFIKTVKALESGLLPASLNFASPNPSIDFENSPFFVNKALTPWQPDGMPRRAGVNSLGVGGTNAFVVLEEPPAVSPSSKARRPAQMLTLSARTETALDTATANLVRHLRQHPDLNLADVAFTLQIGRKGFTHRRVVACQSVEDAIDALEQHDARRVITHARGQSDPSVVFMFPGGGAQYPNMGRQLYETERVYRETVDSCLKLLEARAAGTLRQLMFPPAGSDLEAVARELEMPSLALPSLFITEYALAKLWMSWGIQPAAMTGHSMGEYTAACLAGVMSVKDALSLVTVRGALFETLPEGAMLSVHCTEERLRPLLGDDLDLAAINGPELCLASGPVEAIDRLAERLASEEIEHNRLKISVAAHSRMLQPILEEFGRRVAQFQLHPPTMRWMSNLTGAWITVEEATDPGYWVRHLREAVRFSDGIRTLLEEPNRLFLEVGPGQTLTSLVKAHLNPKVAQHAVVPSTRHPRDTVSDVQFMLTSLGRLWLAGATPDWSALHQGERRRRAELPTYPFERQRYWIEPGKPLAAQAEPAEPLAKVANLDDWFYRPTWKRSGPVSSRAASERLTWLVFRDSIGFADEVIERLSHDGQRVVTVSAGEGFSRHGTEAYTVNPDSRADYDALVADLASYEMVPQQVLHLWSVTGNGPSLGSLDAFESSQSLGFLSLLFLAQALGSEDLSEPLHIGVVSDRMQAINGGVAVRPERATLLGPCKVIPREFPGISCVSIDVALPDHLRNGSAADVATVVDQLLSEMASPGSDHVVALRRGERWVEGFEATTIDACTDGFGGLREGGVYLITGGLGGIGLVQAEYLAKSARAKLVLVGRAGLPERTAWERWLETHAPQDATSRRIRKVLSLELLGAEVLVASADVANLDQMRDVVEAARARFGQIHGVIHAAGVLNDGVIQLKTREAAEQVILPKVKGALVLDAVLAGEALDFFVLFSSTSSILGPAGQVDYVGANAFLNTFAQSKQGKGATRTVALDWGVWQEVGMAARAAGGETASLDTPMTGEPTGHPLLGVRTTTTPDKTVFHARYVASAQWVLNEHRLPDGPAVLPGTGYLEIARAALSERGSAGAIVLDDVFFLSPLAVADDEPTDIRVTIERDEATSTLIIESSPSKDDVGPAHWQEHARASITDEMTSGHEIRSLETIRERCTERGVVFAPDQQTKQEQYITFGPRWHNLCRVVYGTSEALGVLELPEQFSADLDMFAAHPALLDMAAHIGLPLIGGYEHTDDFYVPFSCKRVRLHGALPRTIYSHVRYRPDAVDRGQAAFDVVLMDERGTVLIEIEEFVLRRLGAAGLSSAKRASASGAARRSAQDTSSGRPSQDGPPDLLRLGLTEGIRPTEGAQVLHRVLAGRIEPQIVASSLDLHALMAQLETSARTGARNDGDGAKASQADASSSYVAPRNEVEQKLAGFWQDLMGLERVGIHDDFFDLGGYSLIAVRLFAKIKKTFGVDLALDTLFQASTIARCAEVIADELGIELEFTTQPEPQPGTANGATPERSHGAIMPASPANGNGHANGHGVSNGAVPARRPSSWSPLVPIQPNGSRLPFFFVHGAGGNVLNFRDLARRLGKDQPFYGLQAQGVDGKLPPLERVEDMAALYLREIRQVRPVGPYLLGGFSGGGVIAYEMAHQLLQAGEEVALLAMLDTFCPTLPSRRGIVGNVKNLIRFGPSYALCLPKKTAESLVRKVKRFQVRALENRDASLPHDLRDLRMWDANLRALGEYRPAQYPGAVTLFRATISDPLEDCGLDHLGWSQYVEHGIDIRYVEGTHDNMVLEPGVEQLVAHLNLVLAEAGAAQGAVSR